MQLSDESLNFFDHIVSMNLPEDRLLGVFGAFAIGGSRQFVPEPIAVPGGVFALVFVGIGRGVDGSDESHGVGDRIVIPYPHPALLRRFSVVVPFVRHIVGGFGCTIERTILPQTAHRWRQKHRLAVEVVFVVFSGDFAQCRRFHRVVGGYDPDWLWGMFLRQLLQMLEHPVSVVPQQFMRFERIIVEQVFGLVFFQQSTGDDFHFFTPRHMCLRWFPIGDSMQVRFDRRAAGQLVADRRQRPGVEKNVGCRESHRLRRECFLPLFEIQFAQSLRAGVVAIRQAHPLASAILGVA